jgi:hypothetical protein
MYNVIVLRDAMNCFAGMFGWNDKMKNTQYDVYNPDVLQHKIQRWKEYAYEFIGKTRNFDNVIPINYNLWCIDRDYRKLIASWFDSAVYSEKSLNLISGYGWGSSFNDNAELEKELKNDNTLKTRSIFNERYKECLHIPEFMNLFKDKELIALSKLIFGVNYNVHLL